jgi:hypothetical protein
VSDGGRCLDLARRRVVEEFGDIVLVAHGGFQHGANDGVNVVAAALAICRRATPDMVGRPIDRLRALGYDVREIGQGERILPTAIVEQFTRRADGELVPLVEGSTRPIASTVTHAGFVKVQRYAFGMP